MPKCLYCDATNNLTDDHVFPAAIGGRIKLKNAVCKSCNQRFGAQFEAEFTNGFTGIRNLLGIPDRTGTVPSVPAEVTLDGEVRPAVVSNSGQVFPHSYKIGTVTGPEKEIHYRTFTPAQEKNLMKSMKRKGISLTRATSKIEGEAAVRINLAFIGSAKTHRSIAKIALTGLALKVGDKFALSDTFAPLREFVRTGLGPTPVRLFVSQEVLNRFRINVRYHALIFAFDAHKHRAYSVVVIFGGLFYLVRFTDAYNGVDFSWTYTYNSQAGKHPTMLFGATMISELGMVEKVLAGPTVWNNRKLSAECLMEYVRQVRPDVRI